VTPSVGGLDTVRDSPKVPPPPSPEDDSSCHRIPKWFTAASGQGRLLREGSVWNTALQRPGGPPLGALRLPPSIAPKPTDCFDGLQGSGISSPQMTKGLQTPSPRMPSAWGESRPPLTLRWPLWRPFCSGTVPVGSDTWPYIPTLPVQLSGPRRLPLPSNDSLPLSRGREDRRRFSGSRATPAHLATKELVEVLSHTV
jgi:hypothetical protein